MQSHFLRLLELTGNLDWKLVDDLANSLFKKKFRAKEINNLSVVLYSGFFRNQHSRLCGLQELKISILVIANLFKWPELSEINREIVLLYIIVELNGGWVVFFLLRRFTRFVNRVFDARIFSELLDSVFQVVARV